MAAVCRHRGRVVVSPASGHTCVHVCVAGAAVGTVHPGFSPDAVMVTVSMQSMQNSVAGIAENDHGRYVHIRRRMRDVVGCGSFRDGRRLQASRQGAR
jgi:hypothetical protein